LRLYKKSLSLCILAGKKAANSKVYLQPPAFAFNTNKTHITRTMGINQNEKAPRQQPLYLLPFLNSSITPHTMDQNGPKRKCISLQQISSKIFHKETSRSANILHSQKSIQILQERTILKKKVSLQNEGCSILCILVIPLQN